MKRRGVIILGVIVFGLGIWWLLVTEPRQSHVLSDGSVLSLDGVKIGWTNEFLRGSFLEKTLGRLIPTNGLHLWHVNLQRPGRVTYPGSLTTSLSVQFKLSGPVASVNSLPINSFYREFRAVVLGDDQLEYVSELSNFRKFGNDYYEGFSTSLFPRDSKRLRIRIQQHDASLSTSWRTVAEFYYLQRPAKIEPWRPAQTPVIRSSDDLKISFGEVTVKSGPISTNDAHWALTVQVPWQILKNGVTVTNWNLNQLFLRDASGNANYVGTLKSIESNWIVNRAWLSPDPSKVWKIQASIAEDSGFDESNVFTVHVPLSLRTMLQTNLGGLPFSIGLERPDMLTVELLATNRTDLRLNFLRASNRAGERIDDFSGSWSQFRFRKMLSVPVKGGELIATFAVGRNIPVEFTVQPRLLPVKKE